MSEKRESAGGDDDFGRSAFLREPIKVQSTPLTIMLLLAVVVVMALARSVVLAIAFAWLFKIALTPIVRFLARLGLPVSLAAAATLLVMLGGVGYGAYRLAAPAAVWMQELPQSIDKISEKLGRFREPLARMSEATKQVEHMADGPKDEDSSAVKVEVMNQEKQSLLETLFSRASALLIGAAVTIALLYFMLASDEVFLGKLVETIPRLRDQKQTVASVHNIEKQVARYLLTVSLINLGLGTSIAIGFAVLGMPNPALWGAMGALVNFVPYVGPLVGIGIVAAVALLTFDTLAAAAVPPLVYLALNTLEGLVLTPMILGRSLALSPVAIFLWLMVWGWIWGVPGALLAVPLLTAVKISCDNVPSLQTVGRFLSR